jgi:hypothetical protein
MRLPLAALTLAALLGAVRAQASPDRQPRSPDACALLKAAVRMEFPAGYVGLRFTPTGGFNCSASKGSPGSADYRLFSFGYLPPAAWGSAVAAHKFWQARWNHWRGKSGKDFTVERLRNFGADDAFGVEQRSRDPAKHTDTNITWVKGAYEGGIELAGPGLSGDLDDGQTLLKTLMKGIPPG